MAKRSTRWFRPVRLLGPLVGLLVVPIVVLRASDAAFTSSTGNAANSWGAGTVELVDDDGGSTAMFATSAMAPGQTEQQCIEVTYNGSTFQLANVEIYGEVTTQTGNFADFLELTIDEGTGGAFGSCTGFTSSSTLYTGTLSGFASTHGTYATGLNAFTPASGDTSRTYRFTVKLADTTPDTSQGDTASANFTWEVRSN